MSSPKLTRETMFEPMLVADPAFGPRWEAFRAEWADENDPPLYLALISLSEHLVERLSRGDTSGFERVFAVVEQWHTEGDAYVSQAASVGLLETLQNLLGGNDENFRRTDGVTVGHVLPWLGPETRRWWDKLNRFWDGDSKALRFDT